MDQARKRTHGYAIEGYLSQQNSTDVLPHKVRKVIEVAG